MKIAIHWSSPIPGWIFFSLFSPFYLFPTTGGDDMEWWQTDILAALEAGAEGLEAAQGEIAKATGRPSPTSA